MTATTRPAPARLSAAISIAVAAVALTLSACAASGPSSGLSHTPTLGEVSEGSWVGTYISDPQVVLVPGSKIALTFTEDSVSANAGCNTMNGPAQIQTSVLVAGPMASTLMACDDKLTAQDKWLNAFLTGRPTISVDGDTMWLNTAAAELTLTAQNQ
jgi:heat shock protein HslJ